ncbi:ECF transporter S component [Camelliibacillus cellulosilyticus]|uniref:ECF transporter S component n=1 Tax=Camelliibacillus cellulosilyticus TaxID=2174486 RepID=A0ABV9GFV2_9BACL
MARSRLTAILTIIFLIAALCFQLIWHRHFLIFSFIIMGIAVLPYVIRFERKAIEGRELVLLAVLGAVAAVSRVPFAAFPGVQPSTFVVIISGYVFGAETGFVVGALTALVSNLFLGQGPWTPWQMAAWGLIGMIAGWLRNTWFLKALWGKLIFGFLAGFAFGWIMNLWAIAGSAGFENIKAVLGFYALSFTFDLAHALANVFFLAVFSRGWIKILTRFKRKYGLMEV